MYNTYKKRGCANAMGFVYERKEAMGRLIYGKIKSKKTSAQNTGNSKNVDIWQVNRGQTTKGF